MIQIRDALQVIGTTSADVWGEWLASPAKNADTNTESRDDFVSYFLESSRGIWCLLSKESHFTFLRKTLSIWKNFVTSTYLSGNSRQILNQIVVHSLGEFGVTLDNPNRMGEGVSCSMSITAKLFHAFCEAFDTSAYSGRK